MFRWRPCVLIVYSVVFLSLFLILIGKSSRSTTKDDVNSIPQRRVCRQSILPVENKIHSNLFYIPELSLVYCDVPKAASTNLRRLIHAYLSSSNASFQFARKQIWIDQKHFFGRYSLPIQSLGILTDSKLNLFKFLLVRHPFRRIYSLFHDKFVNDELEDTLFGWKQMEEDILREMLVNQTLLTIRRNDLRLDLRTFLLYIVRSIREERVINSHWQQIVQRCSFCSIDYDWIGKIEHFQRDSQILIEKFEKHFQRIHLTFPSRDLDRKSIASVPLNDSELVEQFRQLIDNRDDFQILLDYYRADFLDVSGTLFLPTLASLMQKGCQPTVRELTHRIWNKRIFLPPGRPSDALNNWHARRSSHSNERSVFLCKREDAF